MHQLKTDPDVFSLIESGLKNFELRFNDRDYKPGDFLQLEQTKFTAKEMKSGKPLEYTGRYLNVNVLYVLYGPIYGIEEGWVVMSIRLVNENSPK